MMPKYTFITDTDRSHDRSDEPLEFPDTKAAMDDAQVALADMARERLPNGNTADFAVKVHDEAGDEIYVAELHFKAKTKDDLLKGEAEADAAAQDVASALNVGARVTAKPQVN
ncbi:MAG: hypothetical protein DCF30_20910 [Hyphomicrobiales bacterium]|nr:MAG: hypothetical protein DCF30_20910 [Hyphomicrobiales bacterium]